MEPRIRIAAKLYPTLVKQTADGQQIRIIKISDWGPDRGYYVSAQQRRRSVDAVPEDVGSPLLSLFAHYGDAQAEADKIYASAINEGYRNESETF